MGAGAPSGRVVAVKARLSDDEVSVGSGVLVSDRMVLTATHVVAESDRRVLGPVSVRLSAPEHRRKHGALYDAVNHGGLGTFPQANDHHCRRSGARWRLRHRERIGEDQPSEVTLGMIPGGGGTQPLMHAMGKSKAVVVAMPSPPEPQSSVLKIVK